MTILIVDDEATIRNWLKMFLEQIDSQHIIIMEAKDGQEAIDILGSTEIDFVMTDIKMPRVNGLEVINHVSMFYPHTQTAVLSAYDDFEFVKIALKSGALDYILKPEMSLEDISELIKAVNRNSSIASLIEKNADADIIRFADYEKKFAEFLRSKDSNKISTSFGVNLTKGELTLSIIAVEKAKSLDFSINKVVLVCDFVLHAQKHNGVAFPFSDTHCILIYSNSKKESLEVQQEQEQKLISVINANLKRYLNVSISYSVIKLCKDISKLHDCFYSLSDTMSLKEYYGQIPDSTLYLTSEASEKLPEGFESAVFSSNPLSAMKLLLEYIYEAHNKFVLPKQVKSIVLDGLNQISILLQRELRLSFPSEKYYHTLLDLVNAPNAYILVNLIDNLYTTFKLCKKETGIDISPTILQAKNYIDKNYMHKVTLEDVAQDVYLNRTYLSLVFKKEMGLSFSDYLENIRIGRARKLLSETDFPVSTVAEHSGFSSQNYFTKVFRKITGISPLKYRNHILHPDINII